MNRPALRYFGGKWLLAPWIISQMPAHRIYVEPFGGAASVLLRKPRSYAEVYNDLDGDIVEFFRVLQDPVTSLELEQKLRVTPFARAEFDLAYQPTDNQVERARRLIVRAFMGFGADGHNLDRGKTGFRSNSNRSGTTPAHDWVSYFYCVQDFCQRLAGVVIENRDAVKVMVQQDSPETLHFVDPPYVHSTRGAKHGYRHEMTDAQHETLIDCLLRLDGMVMLCGYENDIYGRLGWERITRATHADGARDRVEVLWLNDAAMRAKPQAELFAGVATT